MKRAAALLLALGLLQMAADVLGLAPLRGIAAATGASPAPRVFSSSQGLETYSSRFFLEWEEAGGESRRVELDGALYQRIRGPYNRRNTFGAAFAYGPVLAQDPRLRPMFEAVFRHALCGEAPLLAELELSPGTIESGPRVRVVPRPGTEVDLPLVLEVPCS